MGVWYDEFGKEHACDDEWIDLAREHGHLDSENRVIPRVEPMHGHALSISYRDIGIIALLKNTK